VPYTLLLADDSVTIQRVIELTFADEDVKVIAVSDGDQAIARLESSSPDIVLCDIGMPGRNGYEVAKHIKQSPGFSHIPVVLLTGACEPVDQARANEAGCDGVLAKPFEPQLVISRVKELLARSAPRTSSPAAPPAAPPPAAPPPAATAPTAATPAAASPAPAAAAVKPAIDDTLDVPSADEQWGAPSRPSLTPSPNPGKPDESLDDYFDRLDTAFQGLTGGVAPPSQPWDLPGLETAKAAADTEVADLPLAYEPPQGAPQAQVSTAPFVESAVVAGEPVAAPRAEPVVAAEPSAAPAAEAAPLAHVAPREMPRIAALPSLADAFAAILAAEQTESTPAMWPATAPSSDALVDQVTQRVLDRLTDQVVRGTVSDIVSQIAERLVLEEIERIKAAIK